jgi:glycosyltransferase involved in cell wall biosynthesis
MLYIDLPTGSHHGWGICGDHLFQELARRTFAERVRRGGVPPQPLAGTLLQSIGPDLVPNTPGLAAERRVGYVMFEEDEDVRRRAVLALAGFETIVAACTWGEDVLRDAGLGAVTTIPQGIDTTLFKPESVPGSASRDRFVIFSGGKFELRKAQDVVVQAFRAFAARHTDAVLVAAWHNPFPRSAASMIASPYSPYRARHDESFEDSMRRWLTRAGIDLDRVELLPSTSHEHLVGVYRRTDVGLFPNRCEGATNLVLMEYMACGRAAVATDFSGHRDVVRDTNSLPLRAWKNARARLIGASPTWTRSSNNSRLPTVTAFALLSLADALRATWRPGRGVVLPSAFSLFFSRCGRWPLTRELFDRRAHRRQMSRKRVFFAVEQQNSVQIRHPADRVEYVRRRRAKKGVRHIQRPCEMLDTVVYTNEILAATQERGHYR